MWSGKFIQLVYLCHQESSMHLILSTFILCRLSLKIKFAHIPCDLFTFKNKIESLMNFQVVNCNSSDFLHFLF